MVRRVGIGLFVLVACGPSVEPPADATSGDASSSSSSPATSRGDDAPATSVPPVGDDTTGVAGDSTTGVPDATSGTTHASTTGSESDTECFEPQVCQFIGCPDLLDESRIGCDIWAQDCPAGERCTLVTDAAAAIIACAALDPDPLGLGEPCVPVGQRGDTDACGEGLICRGLPSFAGGIDEPLCRPLCTGSEADPQCPDGMFCVPELIPVCYSERDCNSDGIDEGRR